MRPCRVMVVSATRAEYGLLAPLLKRLRSTEAFAPIFVVSGTHLSPEFGRTINLIEADSVAVDDTVEILLSSDSAVGTAKSMGLAMIGFADCIERHQPDVMVLLGDRFELLAVASSALVAGVPLAHIAGGDVTEGAFDEAIRHSITKMSELHFVTNEVAWDCVCQLGEDPTTVYNVGSPALDLMTSLSLLSKESLERDLGIVFHDQSVLITMHPETNSLDLDGLSPLLRALDRKPDLQVIWTMPNADPGSRELRDQIRAFASIRPHVYLFESLGQLRYWSVMAHVSAVVGNSSSGLYDAPTLATPTVNIGTRQSGRLRAESVFDCPNESEAIVYAIEAAIARGRVLSDNPYGDGRAVERMIEVLEGWWTSRGTEQPTRIRSIPKRFHRISVPVSGQRNRS